MNMKLNLKTVTGQVRKTKFSFGRLAFTLSILLAALTACSPGQNGGGGGSGGGGPANSQAAFAQYVHPLLTQYCAGCHVNQAQSPFVGDHSVDLSYEQVVTFQLADLNTPANSRLVTRLAIDLHQCWTTCGNAADEMREAIQNWADASEKDDAFDFLVYATPAVTMPAAGGDSNRNHDGLIALYEFQDNESVADGDPAATEAADTSGVGAALNLTLENDVAWVPGGGVRFSADNPNARLRNQNRGENQAKLYDRIADPTNGSQEYSVEVWLMSSNLQQEVRNVVSYSESDTQRNMTLGQNTNYFNFSNRSEGTDDNGDPILENTMPGDKRFEVSQQIQHVIATYDQTNGRRIYVNSELIPGADTELGDLLLTNWASNYRLSIGNEDDNGTGRNFEGSVFLVAVYNRAIPSTQIRTNFLAGFGDSFQLNFDIGSLVGTPGAAIQLRAKQYDANAYLFGEPSLSLPSGVASLNDVELKGIRIAINNQVSRVGQTFSEVDVLLSESAQQISPLGAVLPLDQGPGPAGDAFRLGFEVIGGFRNVYVEADPVNIPVVDNGDGATTANGLRTFDQIRDTMATLTGVDKRIAAVDDYDNLKTQFPDTTSMGSYLSSHQVGVTKLAVEYCDSLVENTGLRNAMWGTTFQFGVNVGTALDTDAERNIIVNGLWDNMVSNSTRRASAIEVAFKAGLKRLVDELVDNSDGTSGTGANRTRAIVKGACVATLSTAVTTVH